MEEIRFNPVHPDEVLRDELEKIGLTQSALAKHADSIWLHQNGMGEHFMTLEANLCSPIAAEGERNETNQIPTRMGR